MTQLDTQLWLVGHIQCCVTSRPTAHQEQPKPHVFTSENLDTKNETCAVTFSQDLTFVSNMACCTVLNRQSSEVPVDDASGKSARVYFTVCPESTPNPGASECSPQIEASLAECRAADNAASSEASNHVFKEPWNKIFAQAKNRSRRNRPWDNPPGTEVKQYSLCQTPRQLDVINNDSINIQSGETILSGKRIPSVEESKKATPEENGTSDRKRTLRQTVRQAKRSSSVEWDWSGNESDSSKFPQNKMRRALKARKRTPSVDSNWMGSDSEDDENDSTRNEESNKECLICNKTFYRPWRLRAHLYRHIQVKGPYTCDVEGCSRAYFCKAHLDRHKSRNHADVVITCQLKCQEEDCQRLFATGSGLKRHINKVHSGDNLKFQCPHCEKSFSKNKVLRYHLAEHDGQPPLRCDKCNVGFYNDNSLKKHEKRHKEYPCDVPGCEQVFNNYSSFRKHLSEHNKCFKSLQCAHCQKTFTTKFNLRQHVMTHLENKKVFKCTYESCERVYYQEKNLRSHIRVKHEKKSSFECPWSDCGMLFMSKRALWRHVSVHENGPAKPVRKKEKRAPRKDKGLPRKAMATMLAGMIVPAQVEKQLLKESTGFEPSDTESVESPAQNTRSKSKVEIPLLIAGSSAVENISQDSIITSQHINDECDGNDTQTSVLVDNSVIDNFTGRMFEVNEKGFLVEVSLQNINNEKGADLIAVGTEAPTLQSLDNCQKSKLSIECEGRSTHSSEPGPSSANMSGDTAPLLSATLYAETIVECSSTDKDKEVILLIPKTGQSAGESTSDVNPEAVVQALSGDVDIYSVAERDSTVVSKGDQQTETEMHTSVKKVSVSDPSVSSILQPLIEKLAQLPKEKFQTIAEVSFHSNASLNKNEIKSPACSLQGKENSEIPGIEAEETNVPGYCAQDYETQCNEPPSNYPSGNDSQDFEAQDDTHSNDFSIGSVSSCSSFCSCCSRKADVLGKRSPRVVISPVKILPGKQDYLEPVKESIQVVEEDDEDEFLENTLIIDETTLIIDETPNLEDEELVDDKCNKIESVQTRKKKQQYTDKQERIGTRLQAQLDSKYSFHFSDSEPLSEWLKKLRTQATESKVISDGNLSDASVSADDKCNKIESVQTRKKKQQYTDKQERTGTRLEAQLEQVTESKAISDGNLSEASVSSCFESPRKKLKPINFLDSEDSEDDPPWNPGKKKIRSKSKRIISSDSESESDAGVPKKSTANKIEVKVNHAKLPAAVIRKSSGIACRQLSESTWIDILRQVNRNLKLSLSATATE